MLYEKIVGADIGCWSETEKCGNLLLYTDRRAKSDIVKDEKGELHYRTFLPFHVKNGEHIMYEITDYATERMDTTHSCIALATDSEYWTAEYAGKEIVSVRKASSKFLDDKQKYHQVEAPILLLADICERKFIGNPAVPEEFFADARKLYGDVLGCSKRNSLKKSSFCEDDRIRELENVI